MSSLEALLSAVSTVGQVVLIYFLLRGPFKKYILLTVLSLVELFSSGLLVYEVRFGLQSSQYRYSFYGSEFVFDGLLFLIVIVMTYQFLEGMPTRGQVRRILTIVASAVVLLSFIAIKGKIGSTRWLVGASQLYDFGAAIMTLALWSALIVQKKRDLQLLIVTAGLGLAVAGAAADWGLRKFTLTAPGSTLYEAASILMQLLALTRISIWCWAFRPQPHPPRPVEVPKFG